MQGLRSTFNRARRLTATVLATAAVGAVSLVPAAAQAGPPPDLAGEVFNASGMTWETDPDAVVTTAYACDEEGGTAVATATGAATGPYPGTFSEQLTVTLGPADPSGLREIVDIQARFTIDSPVGQVEGTKSFDRTVVPEQFDTMEASCLEDSGSWYTHSIYAITPQLRYSALITAADGTFADFGTATLFYSTFYVREGPQAGQTVDGFEQRFRSDGVAPVVALPTDVDQCRDGGWARFGFRNQGECVRYVVTGKR
ncbi:MAG: hypothetical protein ACLGI2_13640 [Acidimicrobiia bacterium]